eukprot:scaffold2347_cov173-Amphora_coffeaeformis.AAC.4
MKGRFNSMHFVLTVSTGATMTNASPTPAPKPATKFLAGVNCPVVGSRNRSFNAAFIPKRMPALGTLPIKVGAKPRYKLKKPVVRTVYDNPLSMPV